MAHNLSKFIALLINCCGVFLFRTPTTCSVHPNSSAVPSLIFALTVYTFVIDISYFKSAYRKLYLPCQFVLEFLATLFVIESALLDFWFPLENFILSQLVHAADVLKMYRCLGLSIQLCCYLYAILRSYQTAMVCSYSMCFFFLVCVLQGTTVIDLRLMRNGLDVFVQTFVKRLRKGAYRLYPYRGMRYAPVVLRGGNRHRKKGNECQCPSSNLDYY